MAALAAALATACWTRWGTAGIAGPEPRLRNESTDGRRDQIKDDTPRKQKIDKKRNIKSATIVNPKKKQLDISFMESFLSIHLECLLFLFFCSSRQVGERK